MLYCQAGERLAALELAKVEWVVSKLHQDFLPAKPSSVLITFAQTLLRLTLLTQNRIHIAKRDLEILQNLPANAGLILTPNHCDEADPSICLELSRLCKRRFIFMGNREAFQEYGGAAGWGLQRVGVFSIERGGHDSAAKQYAVSVTMGAQNVLVIFPEGEIFYLNDTVQPFHSGAIDIGIQAILEKRREDPHFTALIVPMAIKYDYRNPMDDILDKRVRKMERRLSFNMSGYALQKRLNKILSEVLNKEEIAHNLQSKSDHFTKLNDRVADVRHAMLAQMEERYQGIIESKRIQSRTIDRAWQISAQLRAQIKGASPTEQLQFKKDLSSLNEVAHLTSLQPDYIESNLSADRLAEVVVKLEREVYGIKRPHQLAARDVYLRIAEPIDLAQFIDAYQAQPHVVRHDLAEQMRKVIQGLIDDIDISIAHR